MIKEKYKIKNRKERLSTLLWDILLKAKMPIKGYPSGQLEKRIGIFVHQEMQDWQKDLEKELIKMIDEEIKTPYLYSKDEIFGLEFAKKKIIELNKNDAI